MIDRHVETAHETRLSERTIASMLAGAVPAARELKVQQLNDLVARDPRTAAGVLSFWLSRSN